MRRAITWLILAYLAIALIPPTPAPTGIGIDPSWVWALNLAYAQSLDFGSNILFTFGPLGHVLMPTIPQTPLWQYALFVGLLYASILAALVTLVRRTADLTIPLLAAFALIILGGHQVEYHDAAIVLIAAAILTRRDGFPWWEHLVFSLLTALAFSAKFNSFILGAGLQLFLLIPYFRRPGLWRALALPYLTATLSLGLFIWLSSVWALPGYLRGMLEISSGYSAAMGIVGPFAPFFLAILFILAIVIFIPAISDDRRPLIYALLPAAWYLFAGFKHGFVRQDDHYLGFLPRIAMAAILLLAVNKSRRDRVLITALACAALILSLGQHLDAGDAVVANVKSRLTLQASLANARDFACLDCLSRRLLADSEAMFPPDHLDPASRQLLQGRTVDIFPTRVSFVPANKLTWQPRPVFASYSTYTAYLDRLNADAVQDAGADAVILQQETIDGRIQLFEDPQTSRALSNWYDVAFENSDHLILLRRGLPRYSQPRSIGTITATFGQSITVPSASPQERIIMKVHLPRTLRGKLTSTLLRGSPVTLRARMDSGSESIGRILPETIGGGILLGRWPQTLDEMRTYFDPQDDGLDPRIVNVRFDAAQPADFPATFLIEWLKVTETSPRRSTDWDAVSRTLEPLWKPGTPIASQDLTTQAAPNELDLTPTSIDPQLTLTNIKNLGDFQTIVVRAQFDVADRVELYFGSPSGTRRLSAEVPATKRPIDVYFAVGLHPLWTTEHGTQLRLDPTAALGVGHHVKLLGIWGSKAKGPHPEAQVVFRLSP